MLENPDIAIIGAVVCVPVSILGQAGVDVELLVVKRRSVCVSRSEVEIVATKGSEGRAGSVRTTFSLARWRHQTTLTARR